MNLNGSNGPEEKRNEEAKKLLAEAGYTADKPLTFSLLYNTSDLHKKLAIAVASIWKKNLGVNVKLENQEWKTFLDTRHQEPLTWHVQDGVRTITNRPHS